MVIIDAFIVRAMTKITRALQAGASPRKRTLPAQRKHLASRAFLFPANRCYERDSTAPLRLSIDRGGHGMPKLARVQFLTNPWGWSYADARGSEQSDIGIPLAGINSFPMPFEGRGGRWINLRGKEE